MATDPKTLDPEPPEGQTVGDVENSVMSVKLAPPVAILLLILLALVGIVASLSYVANHWQAAIGPSSGSVADLQVGLEVAKDAFKAAHLARLDAEAANTKKALSDATANPKADAAPAVVGEQASIASLDQALKAARNNETTMRAQLQAAERALGPDPGEVLKMVAVLGALGGLIHMLTSFVMYIGNRQLVRSWLLYYVVAPFLGAALAPIVFLLLSNSVVESVSGSGVNTQNLNLPGLYAIAALTGMFARQASEKLADIFTLVFSKINAQDKLKE
jgi:hypothetical protein